VARPAEPLRPLDDGFNWRWTDHALAAVWPPCHCTAMLVRSVLAALRSDLSASAAVTARSSHAYSPGYVGPTGRPALSTPRLSASGFLLRNGSNQRLVMLTSTNT